MQPIKPRSPWVIWDYERDMFGESLRSANRQDPANQDLPWFLRNAATESLLLHMRILADMILCRSNPPDEVNLNTLLPGFADGTIEEFRNVYGKRNEEGTPCWILNKKLAHPTEHRSDNFDYTEMVRKLAPRIQESSARVEDERRRRLEAEQPGMTDPRTSDRVVTQDGSLSAFFWCEFGTETHEADEGKLRP